MAIQPLPVREKETGPPPSYNIGDHSEKLKGAARFIDNGNGTVTDNLTGVVWLKNANCFGKQNRKAAYKSTQKLASGDCGLTDGSVAGQWRLPSMPELISLMDHFIPGQTLPYGHPFYNIQDEYYWSLTVSNIFDSWMVELVSGNVKSDMSNSRISALPVRSASKKQKLREDNNNKDSPVLRFTDNGNGTVTDNKTGLIWLKNVGCFTGLSKSSAYDEISKLASGSCGLTDGSVAGQWRLPSIDELQILANSKAPKPGISSPNPFINFTTFSSFYSWFWTSTYDSEAGEKGLIANLLNTSTGRAYGIENGIYTWPVLSNGDTNHKLCDNNCKNYHEHIKAVRTDKPIEAAVQK